MRELQRNGWRASARPEIEPDGHMGCDERRSDERLEKQAINCLGRRRLKRKTGEIDSVVPVGEQPVVGLELVGEFRWQNDTRGIASLLVRF